MKGFLFILLTALVSSLLFAANKKKDIYQTSMGCMSCHQGVVNPSSKNTFDKAPQTKKTTRG